MLASVGLNGYEALVNAVAGNIVLALRSKKLPGLERMLRFGLEKALINVLGSFIGHYVSPMVDGVNSLDIEYLTQAMAGGISSYWNPGMSATYLAQEQLMISLVSHLIAAKSSAVGVGYINANLGNSGINTVNPNVVLY